MAGDSKEKPLAGGRQSEGVVRFGDTVHREPGRNAPYVRALLADLQSAGFEGAPRWLGVDDRGRDILTFIRGEVGHGNPAALPDARLTSAAWLTRGFHDATAGSHLAQGREIVAHTDLGPHNMVFRKNEAVGIIDWDDAEPGSRLVDFAHAVWCFVPIGEEGGSASVQGRRVRLMCDSYRWGDSREVIHEIGQRLRRAEAQHAAAGRRNAVNIFRGLSKWFESHAEAIAREAQRSSDS